MKRLRQVQPGLSKSRSRRQRKKLHIDEFQELAFDYDLTWNELPSSETQIEFLEGFLADCIEKRGLRLGGGCTTGSITSNNLTDEDREAVRSWLSRYPGVTEVSVGALVDAWYE